MQIEEKLAVLDVVYFHILELNLHFYQEIYGRLSVDNFTRAIVDAQKDVTSLIKNKQIDDYYERIRRNAV